MPPGYELKSPEPGGFRHILFSFRRAQRLQLLHKVAHIIRAAAGKDAGKRNAQPRRVEAHAQRGVKIRPGAEAQRYAQRHGSRLRGGGFPLLFKNRFLNSKYNASKTNIPLQTTEKNYFL